MTRASEARTREEELGHATFMKEPETKFQTTRFGFADALKKTKPK